MEEKKFTQLAAQLLKRHLEKKYKIDVTFHDIMYMKTVGGAASQLLADYTHVVFGTMTRTDLVKEIYDVIS